MPAASVARAPAHRRGAEPQTTGGAGDAVWHGALHAGTVAESLAATGFDIRAQIIWAKERLVLSRPLRVTGDSARAADFDIRPGVLSDMGEGDEWPGLRARILAADIFVLGTRPTTGPEHFKASGRPIARRRSKVVTGSSCCAGLARQLSAAGGGSGSSRCEQTHSTLASLSPLATSACSMRLSK